MKNKKGLVGNTGFSLIELLIVISIVGILSSIAYPSYQEYVIETHREDVISELQSLELAMQQYAFENHTFVGAASEGDKGVPDPVKVYKLDTKIAEHYTVTVKQASVTGFILTAVPKGKQVEDRCGVITLNSNRVWTLVKDNKDMTSDCLR
ncbi:type IV pilin protein [Litoribrevibacter albus]|uniref:Type IV minor pilin protein PilE n=1 Tax=Litoribrevibacter albus TaxID=1473156 RepID=A0AA37S6A9_9GAMM|nr:type IV pilin protein [Litoribrevibacter albus]GLQ29910.1 type IV minor pilin protein PilE [Litoribrevibacter albus]